MRKINDMQHQRFNKAMIRLKRELLRHRQRQLVVQTDENRRALQKAYQDYTRSVEQLKKAIEHYDILFTETTAFYRETSTLCTRLKAKARDAAKRMGKKKQAQTHKKQQEEEKKQRA